jgi:signal transduction histidine kinase
VIIGLIFVTTGKVFAAHSGAGGWVGARPATLGVRSSAVYAICPYLRSGVSGTVVRLVISVARWSTMTADNGAFVLTVLFIAIVLCRPGPVPRESRHILPLAVITTAPGRPGIRFWPPNRRRTRRCADRCQALATEQEGLRRVATLVARGGNQSEVFSAVAEEMARCLNLEYADVFRYDEEGAAIVVVAAYAEPGIPYHAVGDRLTTESDNLCSTVWRTRRPARRDSGDGAAGSIAAHARELGLRSRVGVPIVVNDRVWGIAVAGNSAPNPLPPDIEERVAEFAGLAATAIDAATTRAELIASRARIVAAADDARRRVERDLHDGAQQRLVALAVKARMAIDQTPAEVDGLKAELSYIVGGLTAVLDEIREISRGIHPEILSSGGLSAALKALARRAAVPVTVDVAIQAHLPDGVEVAVYYVTAEALTNAAKHAHASQVSVCARVVGETLHLSIDDDGIGGADSSKGSGIVGLEDRIDALGGKLTVNSPVGSGTAIDVTIPLALAPNNPTEPVHP